MGILQSLKNPNPTIQYTNYTNKFFPYLLKMTCQNAPQPKLLKATIRGENQPKGKVPKSKINPDVRPVICGKKSTVSEDNHGRVEVRDQSLPSRQQGKEADIAQVAGKQLLSFLIFRMRGGAPGGGGNVGRQRGWVLWPPGWG